MLIDTHAHINDDRLLPRAAEIHAGLAEKGLESVIVVGYDRESSECAVRLSTEFKHYFAAVGVHPHDAKSAKEEDYLRFEELSRLPKTVAIGEIGLDYYYDLSDREVQKRVFRNVRTNLQYMLQDDEKVILVTSTTPGEGKSFTAANLATSFALMDRKTLIVGMDIRKPALNKIFNLPKEASGITHYLASPKGLDVLSLCQRSALSPNLYVLPVGEIPPNPTELVARKSLDEAFAQLRQHFDYIIIDSAPMGVVTDTRLIARVADICAYICRADYTRKSDFELINDLKREKKMPLLCVLVNGIDMDKRKNGYYYGYGKYGRYGKYAYGKKYGHGYGYGKEG